MAASLVTSSVIKRIDQSAIARRNVPKALSKSLLRAPSMRTRSSVVRAAFEDQNPDEIKKKQMEAMKQEYDAVMSDPAQKAQVEAMQQAMQDPAVQQQMQGMSAFMQNPEVQEKIKGLADDPEMKEFFDEIKAKGPGALMKYWNDPVMLNKMMKVIGPTGAVPGPPPPQVPDIDNLWDAAKYGDLEAVEDFVAVGKDVNAQDDVGRTPLHFAVAYNHVDVVQELLNNKAQVDIVDTKNNTPLHYAAGYGREDSILLLLDAGCDLSVKNDTGKTAGELAGMDARNPVSGNEELMKRLTA
mmetsp:Transcript_16790/g.32116  ORF Transcript_16790/g.32116 Transcript_16790/m.32116 type:complete len:298 (-) Transcript_16790:880-1773(-)|eukprot:CAMPEP_0114248950 /NCGR_PEP_ID=MMETSP0058-20121206/13858_1 /TAXON_ID=36894 /ORGANISM="Pyramimonas parkeae, CCMP726" /LENGTH=297 /DNA_ID=CAMNT_0001362415 /DNA_START=55 /DNA_END=948 /DNA_ORIENTATION=-